MHCKYKQWNYSEDTSKNCKTELQYFYCNMDNYFAIYSTMQKCRFKFTVIKLHLEQQSNVKNTVKNCKLDYSYSIVLCTFISCVPYLQCGKIWNCKKYIFDTGGPPLTRKSLTRFPLTRILAYVRASGGFSVSRGPQYSPTNTNFM